MANKLFSCALCVIVFGAAVACGSSDDGPATSQQDETWREQMTEMNDLTCQRVYECFSPALLGSLRNSMPQIGNSVEECQANARAQNANANAPCEPGKTFHSELADQCLVTLSDTSCQQFMMSLLLAGGPESCSSVCS
jgi:hypothetical protein